MSKYCVVGRGFIGGALKDRLLELGHEVSHFPLPDTEIVFYFKGPTHPDFDKNPDYWDKQVEFIGLSRYCADKNIKLIYASSALVYEPEKLFGKYMLAIERQAPKNSLGLRIFPVWGEGGHTVIEEWEKDLKQSKRPVIWADGTQTRDFIHTEEAIEQIISVMGATGIVDIGKGQPKSFNELYQESCEWLGIYIKPKYVKAPKGYQMKGVVCKYPLRNYGQE